MGRIAITRRITITPTVTLYDALEVLAHKHNISINQVICRLLDKVLKIIVPDSDMTDDGRGPPTIHKTKEDKRKAHNRRQRERRNKAKIALKMYFDSLKDKGATQ